MHIEPSIEPGHHEVTFTWHETDPDRSAHAVLVRLVGVTDHAQDDGDLSPYLMHPHDDGLWTLSLRLPSTLAVLVPDLPDQGRAHARTSV